MQLRIYDANLNFLGLIETQSSFMWTRRYFEVGEFKLYAPATASNLNLLRMGNLISYHGANEAGVIEHLSIEDTFKNGGRQSQITVKGRFLESYMDRRLIKQTYNFSGRAEDAMHRLLDQVAPIPLVVHGESNGFEETVSFQATYKKLLKYEQKLSAYSNIGFRFRPDFVNKVIIFEPYKGLNRSFRQTDRNRVVFSDSYGNLNETEYETNSQLYKNVCYVGGQGEGAERTIVVVGDDTLTGLERREMFINASDITQDDITMEEYLQALQQRGQQKLADNTTTISFECETASNGNFVYKQHYDLGDIITVRKPEWGIDVDLRVTEIQEIYENGAIKIEPTFGTPLPSTVDWSEDNE